MTASSATEPFMEAIWDRAVQASGLDPARVHLLPVPGAAVRGFNQAACYPPGDYLVDDPEDLVRGDTLIEANVAENLEKHRIAIYEDVDSNDRLELAVLAGKLRHELRHAEQREACGEELFALDDLAALTISWKAGGLPRSTGLYHMKPIEMDANAASAMFLQDQYPDVLHDILDSDDGTLARSNTPPGDLLDLPAKTVAFMFSLREVAEDPVRSNDGLSFVDRLRLIDPRWATLWTTLIAARSA